MQVLHHNAQGYHSGQAFKKPQKAPRMAAGADSVAPRRPPSPFASLLPNLAVHFVQAIGEPP